MPSSVDCDTPTPNPSRKREGNQEHVSERTCVLTRRKGTRDSLIRLALGPDGEVGPDVRAKAPGRGAWLSVGRAELDAANAKGKLKSALTRAFKAESLEIPANLGEQVERALRQAALDRLGLEARGGTLINGSDRIEAAARAGKVHLLIHSADAREDGRRTLDQAWRAGGGDARGLIFPEDRSILSMALGRENVVHIALIDAAAASRVSHALVRWRAFTDPRTGLDGGVPASAPGSAEENDEGLE
ncbi:MAG: DUF448 domain-containing protein [Sphingomonas sp.]|nr:DUF448 domain-containing protein [Sphingomonas sp.]